MPIFDIKTIIGDTGDNNDFVTCWMPDEITKSKTSFPSFSKWSEAKH